MAENDEAIIPRSDFEYFTRANNENIEMKGKLRGIATYIDERIKTLGRNRDEYEDEDQKVVYTIHMAELQVLAKRIEKDFNITVLTSPRD